MQSLVNHLQQESTWRGLLALAIALGIQIAPEQQEAVIAIGLALIGLINIFKND
jgi:hypothetical protein